MMTLRDYFAAQAIPIALCQTDDPKAAAVLAFDIADAMMSESVRRYKKEEGDADELLRISIPDSVQAEIINTVETCSS